VRRGVRMANMSHRVVASVKASRRANEPSTLKTARAQSCGFDLEWRTAERPFIDAGGGAQYVLRHRKHGILQGMA